MKIALFNPKFSLLRTKPSLSDLKSPTESYLPSLDGSG
jgi:hypothetical protein